MAPVAQLLRRGQQQRGGLSIAQELIDTTESDTNDEDEDFWLVQYTQYPVTVLDDSAEREKQEAALALHRHQALETADRLVPEADDEVESKLVATREGPAKGAGGDRRTGQMG